MGPFPGNWLAARIADLTPDLQVLLSWGSTVVSFHSRQSLSVSFFHVSLGLPGPRLPSICISHAVLITLLERSTCPNKRSLLSLKMRSRSSSSSLASNLLDLTVATSSGLILQICLIMALSLRCKFVLVSGQVSLLCKSCIHGHVSCKRGGGMWELVVAPWTSSRLFSHE